MRRDADLDPRRIARAGAQVHVLINKPDKPLLPIQDDLELYLNSSSPLFDLSVAS
jgi:hypothetical protein